MHPTSARLWLGAEPGLPHEHPSTEPQAGPRGLRMPGLLGPALWAAPREGGGKPLVQPGMGLFQSVPPPRGVVWRKLPGLV